MMVNNPSIRQAISRGETGVGPLDSHENWLDEESINYSSDLLKK